MKTTANVQRRALMAAVLAVPFVPIFSLAQGIETDSVDATLMQIRITFGNHDFTATLFDNASAREFAAMLPLVLTIADYSDNEKIAYLRNGLNELARGPFPNATPGDLCYYVPWGNLVFYYDNYRSTRDLVRLGRLDGGVEPLMTRGEFPLRIERIG